MVKKNIEKEVEFESVTARILSKEDSPKNSDKNDEENSDFLDVKTEHCALETGHMVKEIGPDEQGRSCFQ